MTSKEGVEKSKKGTATRIVQGTTYKRTYIAYKDRSMYMLVSKKGKVDIELSRMVRYSELLKLRELTDWQPSK